MNLNQRNKRRPVVVNQSPVTMQERAEAARTKAELTEALQDTSYALKQATDDYWNLEQTANVRITAIEATAWRWGFAAAALGVGLGHVLTRLVW